MGIVGGLLGGASRGVTANGGIGAAINRNQESDRRDEQQARLEKSAKIKNKLMKSQRLAAIIADPNQSDETIINTVNEFNKINGIPVVVSTIEEAFPQRAEAKKISNMLLKAKDDITPGLLRNVQSLLVQYENKFGENEVLRRQLDSGRASLEKKQNTEIDFLARNIANSANGGKNSTQQIADFTRTKGKIFTGVNDKEISNRVNLRANEFRKNRGGGIKHTLRTSPLTGQTEGIDPYNPGAPPIQVPSPGFSGTGTSQQVTTPPPQRSGITKETVLKGTGPVSGAVAFLSNVFGPFLPGVSETAKKNKEARKSLALFSQRAKSALLNSSRGAVWEQQKLEGRILPTSKIFTDPQAEFAGLVKLREILKDELNYQKNLLNTTTLDIKSRKKITANNIELESLIRQLSQGEQQDTGSERKVVEADGTVIIQMPDGTYKIEEPK